jgi:penicillin-binding protein 1C
LSQAGASPQGRLARKTALLLGAGAALAFALVALFFLLAGNKPVPSYSEVKAGYVPSEAWLLDRNGEVLAEKRIDPKLRRLEWVSLDELSPIIQQLLLVSEDRNFYGHSGVDWRAVFASAGLNLWHFRDGKHPRGASTVTMQLAGFLDRSLVPKGASRSFSQKWNQMQVARSIESSWTKREILEAYLNLSPFRGEYTGINAASQGLFGKHPSALNRAESLLLIALLKGTGASPQVAAKRACGISAALSDGYITNCAELNDLAATFLTSPPHAIAETNIAPQLAQRLLEKPGTRVTTTIAIKLQRFAIQSLQEHLAELMDREVKDGAVIVMDNSTGEILAYVGSNLQTSDAPAVDGIQALRQAGSTLKPFLYGMAIDDRQLTAASVLDDSPIQMATPGGLYIPQDYDRDFKGPVTVRTALASSLNVPAVRALGIVGVDRFVQKLRAAGLDSLTRDGDFYGFSLALGGADVRLIQLTNAYRALANGGVWSPVGFASSSPAEKPRRILSAQAAFIIADILSDSGARATTFGFGNSLETRAWTAVKTGTSKDMRDNWCIGFSDRYTVGVWVGNFSGEPMRDVSGVSGAAPVWKDIMDFLHNNQKALGRKIPPKLIEAQVTFVPEVEPARREWFIKGTESREVRLAAYEEGNKGHFPKILYPGSGTIIAVDPDIPQDRQRVQFSARSGNEVTWVMDGKVVGSGQTAWWLPRSGRHSLALNDAQGKTIDRVSFEVRGELEQKQGN